MIAFINVAGCMDRIGTTTQALQLARFIKSMDYDVAYMEMNDKNYIKNTKLVYSDYEEQDTDVITVQGIDVIPRNKLSDIRKGGANLDFLIIDHGTVNDKKFDKKEFLQGGVPILVGGIKANELLETENALRDKDMQKAFFIFSFVEDGDNDELLVNMGKKKDETFFSPYFPDPFVQMDESKEDYFQQVMSAVMQRVEGGN